ncbi:MFS transporter [Naumannella huperziae]
MSTPSTRDRRELSPRHLTLLLALMCAGLALTIAANVSLNVALPLFGTALGATQSQLSWVMNAYTLPFAALLLPAGAIADRMGLRYAVSVGLAIFGVTSFASAFADDAGLVIALRVVSALGATLVLPATLSVLTRAFPADKRAKAVGIWAAVSGSGAVLGLVLGGVFVMFFWWGSVLASTGIAAVVVAIASFLVVPTYRRETDERLDVQGSVLFALALGLLVFGLIQGPELGWGSWVIVGSFVGGAALMVAFVRAQLRTPAPLLDVQLFRSSSLSVASLTIVLLFAATIGLFLLLPQMLQNVRDYTPLFSALGLVPLPVGIAVGSQIAERTQGRLGERAAVAGGVAVSAAALAWLGLQAQYGPYWALGLALLIFGIGFGLSTTVATTMIIDSVPGDDNSTAAALNDALREVGAALGIALLGTVLNAAYRAQVANLEGGFDQTVSAAVRDGFGPAAQVASSIGEPGTELLVLVRDAFYVGYQASVFTAAATLVVAGVVAVVAGRGAGAGVPGTRGSTGAEVLHGLPSETGMSVRPAARHRGASTPRH